MTALATLAALAACSGSPASPTPAPPTPAPPVPGPGQVGTSGRVFDIFSGTGIGGISLSGAPFETAVSDASGAFVLLSAVSESAPRRVIINGPDVVGRETGVRVPGPDASLSLIPNSFDLAGFDQMFRAPVLRRWTTAPAVDIVTQVLEFESLGAAELRVLDEPFSESERGVLLDDLVWALPQLTGDTFGAFASVSISSPPIGSDFMVLRTGMITVARVDGLTAGSGFAGYARWQWNSSNEITAGLIMLDRGFETSGRSTRRNLRSHELGHALGYNHVTSRTSIMNSSAQFAPTMLDLMGARLAFARLPGNRSPDIDPASYSTNRVGVLTWSDPVR